MARDVQPPVFVVEEGLGVTVDPSLEDATRALEGIDVERGIYKIFDSTGRRITLRVRPIGRARQEHQMNRRNTVSRATLFRRGIP